MAIFHLTTNHVTRSSGRSAVAASAYRAGVRLLNERDGTVHDYLNRTGVLHTEIILPRDSKAEWALDREKLWNAAETAEKRKDSRTAREIEFALPEELNFEQQMELSREMGIHLSNLYGTAVDIAIHAPSRDGDQRNYHVHALMPTRTVGPDGLGDKTMIERSDRWLRGNSLQTGKDQLSDVREVGEQIINHHLAKAGLDVRVDCGSHEDRGLKIKPTRHVGVHATSMRRKGKKIHRTRLSEEDKQFNRTVIDTDPEELLKIITSEKSVFDMRDVARCIHRYTGLKGEDFQTVFTGIMTSPYLVKLELQRVDDSGNRIPAKYSTREMVDMEVRLMENAEALHQQKHDVSQKHTDRAVSNLNRQLQAKFGGSISPEQRKAVEHLTGPHRMSIMVGHAGTGKSTVLGVANHAWKSQGYNVLGAALSGKASDGLEQASGIRSQTLASLDRDFAKGRRLGKRDILVIDETGMVDNKQLARVIAAVSSSGAKLVLVGDPEQLQPIGAGGAFRSLAEAVGSYNLTEIRRQKTDWQAKASGDFATLNTRRGLLSYDLRRAIVFDDSKFDTIRSVVGDYVADFQKSPDGTRLAISHKKNDVKMLNAAIRSALKASGYLAEKGEVVCQTREGLKSFVKGDRVALQANSQSLGLKNGMLATITKVSRHTMTVTLDDGNRSVRIPMDSYRGVSHGYATTIHKSQGSTVDSAYVLASRSMDRHLSYVAMTRHKENARMYASRDDFSDREDLFKTLSRGNEKKSVLDFMHEFGERRRFERFDSTDFKPKTHSGNRQSQESESPGIDVALDFFGMAMEERLWMEFHGIRKESLPAAKLEHALRLLDRAQPGLSQLVMDATDSYQEHLKEMFIYPSGDERVAVLKKAVNQEVLRRTREPEAPSFGF